MKNKVWAGTNRKSKYLFHLTLACSLLNTDIIYYTEDQWQLL